MNYTKKRVVFYVVFLLQLMGSMGKCNANEVRSANRMEKRVVVCPVANMRSAPEEIVYGIKGPALSKEVGCQETQLLFGEYLYAEEVPAKPDWLYVCSQAQVVCDKNGWHNYEGYVKRADTQKVRAFVEHNLVVASLEANLFDDNRLEHPRFPLSLGTTLHGVSVSPEAYKIVLPLEGGGLHEGFVAACHVRSYKKYSGAKEEQESVRNAIIALGRHCLGFPYVWGGRSLLLYPDQKSFLAGADCSSFIELIFRTYGIILPRNAHDQYLKSTPIQKGSQLQPGDLIFITSRSNEARMSHVMLYAGNGMILHLSGDGYSSVSQAPNPALLAVREETDIALLGNRLTAFNNGDRAINGLCFGSKIFFGSFF